jgi:hypothetical protein
VPLLLRSVAGLDTAEYFSMRDECQCDLCDSIWFLSKVLSVSLKRFAGLPIFNAANGHGNVPATLRLATLSAYFGTTSLLHGTKELRRIRFCCTVLQAGELWSSPESAMVLWFALLQHVTYGIRCHVWHTYRKGNSWSV